MIHTATAEITLDNETAAALLERIWRAGGPYHEQAENPLLAAINKGSGSVSWSDDSKDAALLALDGWIETVGARSLPTALLELQQELLRDLKRWPFDSE